MGGDGAGPTASRLRGLNGATGTVGTETVNYSWAGQHADGDGSARGALFTVVVTPATGAYTVTLLDNVLHAGGPNEENATDPTTSLAYSITDADGSLDHRHADRDLRRRCADGDGEASQNVAEGATVTGTLDFVQGADGASVTHIGGMPLVFGGRRLFAADRHRRRLDQGEGGRVVLVHGGQPGDVGAGALATATFTVTDGDGDTATATVSFQVTDANVPTSGSAAAAVDDDGLPGGNPASTT